MVYAIMFSLHPRNLVKYIYICLIPIKYYSHEIWYSHEISIDIHWYLYIYVYTYIHIPLDINQTIIPSCFWTSSKTIASSLLWASLQCQANASAEGRSCVLFVARYFVLRRTFVMGKWWYLSIRNSSKWGFNNGIWWKKVIEPIKNSGIMGS